MGGGAFSFAFVQGGGWGVVRSRREGGCFCSRRGLGVRLIQFESAYGKSYPTDFRRNEETGILYHDDTLSRLSFSFLVQEQSIIHLDVWENCYFLV